jgi:hypothetical protein
MSTQQRFLLYLYSNGNILGSILGLVGLGLYFTGIIHDFWLLIVIGLYGIGVLAAPRNETQELRLRHQLDSEELRGELEELVHAIRRRVPKEVYERVVSIKNTIVEILPFLQRLDESNYNLYTIRQTALEYLPETLENYLKLPRAYASMHVIKEGKTAQKLLVEQLDLLDEEMKSIAQEFYRNNTEELVAHGRFLEEKFERSGTLFGIGSG